MQALTGRHSEPMRRPSRPHGTAFRHPDSTGRLSLAHGFTMTRAESQAPPNTARCASVARTVVLGALPARRSPAQDRAVPWQSRNLKSKTAGRHLLPMGRSFRFHGTGSCQGGDAEQVSLGVLTRVRRTSDADTTPSASPSRMNACAGWSRVTGAIPSARASAQLTRPFRLSSHAAISSGTLAAAVAVAGTSPRAHVITTRSRCILPVPGPARPPRVGQWSARSAPGRGSRKRLTRQAAPAGGRHRPGPPPGPRVEADDAHDVAQGGASVRFN